MAIGYNDGTIEIQDTAQGQIVWHSDKPHGEKIIYLAFDQEGKRLISTSTDKTTQIWNLEGTNKPIVLAGHTMPVDVAVFSPNGDLIVTGSSDSTFRLWDAHSGVERRTFRIPKQFLDPIHNASINPQAAFTSDGKQLVTVTSGDGYVISQPALVWDVDSGKLLQALQHNKGAIWDVVISPDDRYVITTSYDNTCVLWDINTGDKVQTFTGHSMRVLQAVIYNQGRLIATVSQDGSLRIWEVATGRTVKNVQIGSNLNNLALSQDGERLAVGSDLEEGTKVGIWDAVDGRKLLEIENIAGPLSPLNGLAFAAEDQNILTRTRSGIVSIWPLPHTGQALIDFALKQVGDPGQELLTKEQRIRFAIEAP